MDLVYTEALLIKLSNLASTAKSKENAAYWSCFGLLPATIIALLFSFNFWCTPLIYVVLIDSCKFQ